MLNAPAIVNADISSSAAIASTKVSFGGTNGQLLMSNGNGGLTYVTDGWTPISATLTYSSTDGHTFVVTISTDMTGLIGLGDRIKFTNNGITFYGIVTAITSTTITLYGGTQYSVANSTITVPFYSHMKSPYGFNPRPDYWQEQVTNNINSSQSNPTASTWYNIGSVSIAIPIGSWNVFYKAITGVTSASNTILPVYTTLSTANNSESDTDFTSKSNVNSVLVVESVHFMSKYLILNSKTLYYLNTMTDASGTSSLTNNNGLIKLVITAVCGYL